MKTIEAIKKFFEDGGNRPVSTTELKALGRDEREELGRLAAAALGSQIEGEQIEKEADE